MSRSLLRRRLWGLASGRPTAAKVHHPVCRPRLEHLEDRTVPAGEPILIVTAPSNPFSNYYSEVLRAEGLNEFATSDLAAVSPAALADRDVVILGEMSLTASQVTMFSNWVTAGGNLIAMRPDKQLAGLLGLTDAASTRANAYLLVNTASGPGVGIVNETIQYHGTADAYTLNGASSLATLYATATTATPNPAVTLRNVGGNGGQAAAFTYDLARSIVYTRQGNPAWSGQERDGVGPIRSNDLFYGNATGDPQPDWIDLNKVDIPQADEQQRLLANLITEMNLDNLPLPRFWYLPRGEKAAVIMTGDDHGNGGTASRFNQYISASPAGSTADDWSAIRSTSYIYPNTPLTQAQAAAYAAQGFEIALHVNTNLANWTPAQLEAFYANQLAQFQAAFPNLPAPVSNRTHALVWSDYATQPQVELAHGIRLDTNYYYFGPAGWIQDRPGMFTGSGMPMRFADANGNLIDVYQAATQMTDESGQTYPFTVNSLLDAALDTRGYYGVFTANMHTDEVSSPGSDAIIESALARSVPVVSAKQMLTWLDGRNSSSFSALGWNSALKTLSFTITPGTGANGLEAMVPVRSADGVLTNLTRNGTPLAYTIEAIKGIPYAFFSGTAGTYAAQYGSDSTPPTVTARTPTSGSTNVPTTVSITATFSESVNPSTISFVVTDSGGSVAGSTAYNPDTNTITFTATGGLDPATTYTVTVSAAKDHAGNTMVADSWSFTTTSTVTDATIWPTSALPNVASSSDTNPQELGVKFRSDIAGYITGVRFYKGEGNTGTHVGHLWTASGTLLASATFTSETATGWQQVNFAQPVQIEANTTYVASYFAPNGGYAFDAAYFASSGVDTAVLHALSNAAAGGNGVFRSGSSGFPNSSFNSSNYWVDVVFSNTLALGIAARTPPPNATGVSVGSTITATFTRAMNPTTVNTSTFRLRAVGASSDVAATVTYSGLTATITPTQPLVLNTIYEVTVSGSMTASDGTPFGSDTTWSFTTQPHLSFTDTTTANFTAGAPDANVVFVETGNGEAILKPIAGTEFSGTTLPSDWTGTPWSGGGAATVANGQLTVNGAFARTNALFTPGRSLEFVANFSGDAFQHVGFADDFSSALWAMFSTNSGGALYARTAHSGGSTDTLLSGSLLGGSHHFRIDWTATGTTFFVDGVQVASHSLAVTNSLRPMASDFNVGGGTVTVDWMRLTPHAGSGTFVSRVFDAGSTATWVDATWTAGLPAATSVALSVRTGNTPTPDGTWTSFIPLANPGTAIGAVSRYLQYQVILTTSNPNQTPILQDVTIQYDPNTAPVASDDTYSTNEDTQLVISAPGVLANDTAGTLTAILVSGPSHGTLTLNSNGSFTYTPAANYNGPDSFTYKANDGEADSNVATVSLTVTAVNDAPGAVANSYSTAEDTQLVISAPGVLGNDSDIDSGTLTAVLVSGVSHGTLTLNTNGSFTYTPAANYNGTDSFTYRVNDGSLNSNTVTVSLTVTAVNDAPVAVANSYSTNEDTQLVISAPGVLGNDTDGDGNPLTAVLVTGPSHGTLTLNANGSFTYTPAANYNGPDSFTYKANDGQADSNTVTVSITVTAVNDAPVAVSNSYSTNEDTQLIVNAPGVLGNDTDVDGGALTAVLVSSVSHGSLTLNSNGGFTYTPTANYNGLDSFTYRVSDGSLNSNTVTVSLTVTAVNDAPVAVANSYSTPEEITLNVAAPGLLGNDTDVDGDPLTALLVNGPSHGTITWNANGSFSYTPDAQYSGPDSFTYRAQDSGGGLSNVVTVSLTVTPPTLSINNVSANEGTVTTPFIFTVTLSSPTSRTITVNYATANGTATAGILPILVGDYTSTSDTLTFTGGQTSKTITVSVTGDIFSEPNETFFVNLSGANTPIADNQGLGTILNDDILLVTGEVGPGAPEAAVTPETLAPIVAEATARWAAAGMDIATLSSFDIRIADLPDTVLGVTTTGVIYIDVDAAGHGWFIDPTPGDDREFSLDGDQGEQNRVDLLTVVAHEMGHALGLQHSEAGVMQEQLEPGVRHPLGCGCLVCAGAVTVPVTPVCEAVDIAVGAADIGQARTTGDSAHDLNADERLVVLSLPPVFDFSGDFFAASGDPVAARFIETSTSSFRPDPDTFREAVPVAELTDLDDFWLMDRTKSLALGLTSNQFDEESEKLDLNGTFVG